MKLLKALMISMSVGCLRACKKIILIKEQDLHQFVSANVRLPTIHWSPQIQNILWICICKRTGPRSTCTSVTLTHSLPRCPPRLLQHHGRTGADVRVTLPPAGSLCPNVMCRNATRGYDLCGNENGNETTHIAVLSQVTKKTGKTENVGFTQKNRKNRTNFKTGTVTPLCPSPWIRESAVLNSGITIF